MCMWLYHWSMYGYGFRIKCKVRSEKRRTLFIGIIVFFFFGNVK